MWRTAIAVWFFPLALAIGPAAGVTAAAAPQDDADQGPLIPQLPGDPAAPAAPADEPPPVLPFDPEALPPDEAVPEVPEQIPDVEVPEEVEITDVTEGEGPEAQEGDFAVVHLVGRVRQGPRIEDTREEGRPRTLRIGHHRAIEGLNEGLPGMRAGGRRELVIPPDKAFGREGLAHMGIPPGAVLEYEVEMLELHPGIRRERQQEGVGDAAVRGDLVSIRFRATFTGAGGQEVTLSSGDEPHVVALGYGRALLGVEEGLEGVKAGERVTLKLDPRLAFGVSGLAGVVPENARAEYDIEVLNVEPGVIWQIEEEGSGDAIQPGDEIRVHVTVMRKEDEGKVASTFDGQGPLRLEFDEDWEPFPSLFLAMDGMKPGEVRLATIAAPFAFASRGYGEIVPPDTDLLYRIELVED